MKQMMQQTQQDPMAEAGRGTDTVLAHMSLGEIVIPRAMQDDPQFMEMLQGMFQQYGADINEFTVGHEANKINPETGYPEFFGFRRLFRRIAPFIAPALAIAAPGVGTALGSALLGSGAAGASTLGSGLIGAAGGALSGGGLKGALTGGALGALSPNIGDILGNFADPALAEGVQGAVRPAQGLLGQVGNITGLTSADIPSLGSVLGGGSAGGGGGSSFNTGNLLSTALGGYGQDEALRKQREQLAAANQQQLGNLESLNPVDVQNDPGYQFAQQQGEQALNRSLGATGNVFSGRALQAASDLNQNLASRFYGDAYGRQAGKVGAQNAIYGNTGINNAAITGARADNISSSLAKALGGNQGMTLEEMRRLGLI